jgi:hypothetical protein
MKKMKRKKVLKTRKASDLYNERSLGPLIFHVGIGKWIKR